MKKKIYAALAAMFMLAGVMQANLAGAEENTTPPTPKVQETPAPNADTNKQSTDKMAPQIKLTPAQKDELATLFEEKLAVEKKIIDKYAEFGVMSKEQAMKIWEHKQNWSKQLEKNGYLMPRPEHFHKKPAGE